LHAKVVAELNKEKLFTRPTEEDWAWSVLGSQVVGAEVIPDNR